MVDKPIIQYAFEEARAAGIEEFVFVTGRGKSVIEDHFDRAYELDDVLGRKGKLAELEAVSAWMPAPGELSYTRQQEPLGLGHAVWCARQLVGDEPFAVILVDDLIRSESPACSRWSRRRPDRRQHRRGRGGRRASRPIATACSTRPRRWLAGRDQGHGREARPAEAPRGSRSSAATFCARGVRAPGRAAERRRRRDPAHRRDGQDDRAQPFHGVRFEGRRFDCGAGSAIWRRSLPVRWSARICAAGCERFWNATVEGGPAAALRSAGAVEVTCASR